MDWYYMERQRQERPVRTIEDSFKDLEMLFKDRNTNHSEVPRILLTEGLTKSNITDSTVCDVAKRVGSIEDTNYVVVPGLPLISSALQPTNVLSPAQSVGPSMQQPLRGMQLTPIGPTSQQMMVPPTLKQPRALSPTVPLPASVARNPLASPQTQRDNWKLQQRKSLAIIPPWIHVPDHSRFFVIKSSSLEHVKKSFYNGIWSSTFYGNKRLSEAYGTLPEGAKIYLLFSVNASGRFCGVAEMSSGLRDDLNTSIWGENSRYRNAFKVRWIVVRDVHNRSLKQFLIPSNDMKPVTNSRDTQEIPPAICKSILKLFKYEQSEVQSFLDDDYS